MPDADATGADSGPLAGALDAKKETNADTAPAEQGGSEVKFNVRVPEPLRDRFSEVCESEGRSMSWVVREWMRQAVESGETGL